jgi:hypothetical protein
MKKQQTSKLERLIEKHAMPKPFSDFYTTPLFWDCECMEDYIHPASESRCLRCGAARDESPDSRVREVLNHQDIRRMETGSILEEVAAEMGILDEIGISIPF